jgi:hypothetical protein
MAKALTRISPVSNDGTFVIEQAMPYMAQFGVVGTADILFHRWSIDGVEAKSKAAKGSNAKLQDDLESYVYRNVAGDICIPGEYFRMAAVHAARFRQDPRSPRKSAMDLFKAGIAVLDHLCSLGVTEWGYVDRRRVMIQRNAITRSRPALHVGWTCEVTLQVLLPEYITPTILNEVVQNAGRLIGVGDFRPTFGRFQVTGFAVS